MAIATSFLCLSLFTQLDTSEGADHNDTHGSMQNYRKKTLNSLLWDELGRGIRGNVRLYHKQETLGETLSPRHTTGSVGLRNYNISGV